MISRPREETSLQKYHFSSMRIQRTEVRKVSEGYFLVVLLTVLRSKKTNYRKSLVKRKKSWTEKMPFSKPTNKDFLIRIESGLVSKYLFSKRDSKSSHSRRKSTSSSLGNYRSTSL